MDEVSDQLSKISVADLDSKINDPVEVPKLVKILLDKDEVMKNEKLISSLSKDSLLQKEFKDKIKNYEALYKFVNIIESNGDIKLISTLILLLAQDDLLINNILKINKDLISSKISIFQIKLLYSVISNFDSINNQYFVNLSVLLPHVVEQDFKSIILLVIIKLNEIDSTNLELSVLEYLDDLILLNEPSNNKNNFKVLQIVTILFPILSFIPIYIGQNSNFQKLLDIDDDPIFYKFLATCCISEQIRNIIIRDHFTKLVKKLSSSDSKVLIALIITKVWNYTDKSFDLSRLISIFKDAITTEDKDDAIEGLLYLSLQIKLKEILRSDVELIDKFLQFLKNDDNSVKFGVLNIFTNLSIYNDDDEINDERNILAAKKDKQLDDESQIESFLKYLIDNDCHLTNLKSMNLKLQLIKLVSNFAHKNKNLRIGIVKHGGLRFVIEILTIISNNLKYDSTNLTIENKQDIQHPEIRLRLIKTLLKLLISNNPSLIFSDSMPPQTCIPFLCELLEDEQPDKTIFEILIALINLSSLEDLTIKNLIIKISFTHLQDLILSSNTLISKTAIELIANLSLSPILVEKYFNFEKLGNVKNYKILLNLLNSVNVDIQIAILNFFANVSEFELICLILVGESEFVELMIEFIQNGEYLQNEEFLVRLIYILNNLCYAIQDKEEDLLRLRRNDLKKGILKILETIRDEEILQMCVNICNIIDFAK